MSALEDLVTRYRGEIRRLLARRRELDAHIAARREILSDLQAALAASGATSAAPPRRGRITQAQAVSRVLGGTDRSLTAGEIYAAAIEAGAGGSERSLRNVLSRKVRDGELTVDRRSFPQHYRTATAGDGSTGSAP
jgi:hypothetical protein